MSLFITNKEYRAREGISKSSLEIIKKSPLHFKYAEEHPKEDTPSLLFGRAAHKYILEKENFETEFVVAPNIDRRTGEGKMEWVEFMESVGDREIIERDKMEQIIEMDKAIDAFPLARQLLTGVHESSYFWTDATTGEICKCRPDCLTEYEGKPYITDYKTCDSCQDGLFERNVRKFGYKLQSGMYCEGLLNCELEEYGFAFIAQEKKAPYAVRVYICDKEFIREGYDEFRTLMGIYHDCKTTGNWYGYEGAFGVPAKLLADDQIYRKTSDSEESEDEEDDKD